MHTNFNKLLLVVIILSSCLIIQANEANIKPGINLLKSAIVPGWGQLSLKKNYGYGYVLAEVTFWSMQFYFNQESDNNADASFKYAIKYGEVDPSHDYSEQFFEDMREYLSSGFEEGGYNAHIAEKAQNLYPEDSEKREQYINENSYKEDEYWNWASEDHKVHYGSYRRKMDAYADYMKLMAGAIAANHIISAFDALRLSNYMKKVHFSVNYNSDHKPLLNCSINF